jgi:hypothetical protein
MTKSMLKDVAGSQEDYARSVRVGKMLGRKGLTECRSFQDAVGLWVNGEVGDSAMSVWLLLQLCANQTVKKPGGLVLPGGLNVKGPR